MAWFPETSSIASPVLDIYNRLILQRPKDGNMSAYDCERLIVEILQTSQEASAASFRIIVDALNECEEPSKLLNSLHAATRSCKNVYFLLLSRFDVRISTCFRSTIQVHTSTEKSLEDMTFFIHKVIEGRDYHLLAVDNSDLKEELITLLCYKADGM
jgi:hypothetical protein